MKKCLCLVVVIILTIIFCCGVRAQEQTDGWYTQIGCFVPSNNHVEVWYWDVTIGEYIPILVPDGWHIVEGSISYASDGSISYKIEPDGRWSKDLTTGHLFWVGDPGEGWHVEQGLPCPDGYHVIWSTLAYGLYGQPSYDIKLNSTTTPVV